MLGYGAHGPGFMACTRGRLLSCVDPGRGHSRVLCQHAADSRHASTSRGRALPALMNGLHQRCLISAGNAAAGGGYVCAVWHSRTAPHGSDTSAAGRTLWACQASGACGSAGLHTMKLRRAEDNMPCARTHAPAHSMHSNHKITKTQQGACVASADEARGHAFHQRWQRSSTHWCGLLRFCVRAV